MLQLTLTNQSNIVAIVFVISILMNISVDIGESKYCSLLRQQQQKSVRNQKMQKNDILLSAANSSLPILKITNETATVDGDNESRLVTFSAMEETQKTALNATTIAAESNIIGKEETIRLELEKNQQKDIIESTTKSILENLTITEKMTTTLFAKLGSSEMIKNDETIAVTTTKVNSALSLHLNANESNKSASEMKNNLQQVEVRSLSSDGLIAILVLVGVLLIAGLALMLVVVRRHRRHQQWRYSPPKESAESEMFDSFITFEAVLHL